MRKPAPRKGRLYIGTSGLALPFNKTHFPEAFKDKSRLAYYSTLCNSIEINSSFYTLPLSRTLARWGAETDPAFKFTLKLSKTITHAKDLAYKKADIRVFFAVATALHEKAACLLVQFPGGVKPARVKKVNRLLEDIVTANHKKPWCICVEFRDKDWYTENTMQMLDALGCSLVLHDMPASKTILPNPGTVVVYLRFHGEEGNYRGDYPATVLNGYAKKIKQWLKDGKDVYAYFNNTMGNAFNNAQFLQQAVIGKSGSE